MPVADPARQVRWDRAYTRAVTIRDGLANGFWRPVIRRLAHAGMVEAIVLLADDESDDHPQRARLGYRLAWRRGSSTAAYNRAIDSFNHRDLHGYRSWLARAMHAGDTDAAAERQRFELRLPHDHARHIGRGRPSRRAERS